jgi:hypothetical protein
MDSKYNWKTITWNFIKDSKIYILIILVLLMGIYILENTENFLIEKNKDIIYEKDRTLLYGSLFLDNLDKQIKNMTDPRIEYDDKRIDIIKYNDVLF